MNGARIRDLSGKEISVTDEVLKLGRAVDNDVVLNDMSVSRYHLALQALGEGVIIYNTGSDAGFYLNDQWHLDTAMARSGDVIRIGAQEFIVDIPQRKANDYAFATTAMDTAGSTSLNFSSRNKRIRLVMFAVIILMGGYYFMDQPDAPKDATATKKYAETATLPNESYLDSDSQKLGPQEITAADLYKRGMREAANGNQIRAMQWFQQAQVEDPSLKRAHDALVDQEVRLKNRIETLVLDCEKNYRETRLGLARSQANQALDLISEQIPGFSFQVQQRQRSLSSQRAPIKSREMIYLEMNCDQAPDQKICERAVETLKRARIKLGEENTLK